MNYVRVCGFHIIVKDIPTARDCAGSLEGVLTDKSQTAVCRLAGASAGSECIIFLGLLHPATAAYPHCPANLIDFLRNPLNLIEHI